MADDRDRKCLAGAFRAVAGFSVRRPWLVLGVTLVLLAVSVAASRRLEVRTSNLDLVDPDLPEVRAFLDFAGEFGTPNVLVVALEGSDEQQLRKAVDRVGPLIAGGPGVDRVLDRLPYDDATLGALGLDRYFKTHDGGMYFLFVQPDDPYSSAVTIEPFVRGVRERLSAAGLDALHVRAGLTGMPAYALDDRDIVQREVSKLSLASFVMVLFLFFAAFRSFRRPMLGSLALLVGVGWTLGLITLLPGHLTLLSAFFATILFGLGEDYGIHLVGRVEELLGRGIDEHRAIPLAADGVSQGFTTGAVTTALVFLGMNFSGFRGFAELGTIAAMGVAACLVASITVLPALLTIFRPRRARTFATHGSRIGRLLMGLQRGWIAVPLGLLSLAGLFGGPGFDGDYLNLQPAGSEAVRIEREMVRRTDLSPAFAAFVVATRDEAARLTDRLLDEPTVGDVHSIIDLDEAAATAEKPPEVPASFLAAFQSPAGNFAVYAYPSGDIWDPGFQDAFVTAMKNIDPRVTGMPLLGRFMVDRSKRAMVRAVSIGAAVLLVCLLLDFRRPWPAFLAALPAALTLPAMLGLMRLFHVQFNPLNVMALPVVLSIAVDDGLHIVHRFIAEHGDLGRTLAGTGRSIALTTATTLAAFGALAVATHRGLASFAIALCIGVGVALVLSVLVLPWLLVLTRSWLPRQARQPALEPSEAGLHDGAAPSRSARGTACGWIALVLLCVVPMALAAQPTSVAEQRGDAAWAERARGFAATGAVDPSPAKRAVEAYSEALAAEPGDLALRFKAIEALYFTGHFAVRDEDTRRELSARQLELAEGAVAQVEAAAGGTAALRGLEPAERARRLQRVPLAREASFWSAISWGVWAISHGNMAAARRGAAGRIRDQALTLIALDESYAAAGGLRLLGRLHTATPRVPLITGWIDRGAGLLLLRRANAISQADTRNPLFLAEAILKHEPGSRAEALSLLREVVGRTPAPGQLVEETEILEQARAALSRAEGGG